MRQHRHRDDGQSRKKEERRQSRAERDKGEEKVSRSHRKHEVEQVVEQEPIRQVEAPINIAPRLIEQIETKSEPVPVAPPPQPAKREPAPRVTTQQRREDELTESLYRAVVDVEAQFAGKVTGILMDRDSSEVSALLASPAKLREAITEAKSGLSKTKTNNAKKCGSIGLHSRSQGDPSLDSLLVKGKGKALFLNQFKRAKELREKE